MLDVDAAEKVLRTALGRVAPRRSVEGLSIDRAGGELEPRRAESVHSGALSEREMLEVRSSGGDRGSCDHEDGRERNGRFAPDARVRVLVWSCSNVQTPSEQTSEKTCSDGVHAR